MKTGTKLILIFTLLIIFSCEQKDENETRQIIQINENVNNTDPDIYLSSDTMNSSIPMMSEQAPEIPLDEKDYLIFLIDENLDLDNKSEQIIAVKNKNEPDGKIRIIIVDFDEIPFSQSKVKRKK